MNNMNNMKTIRERLGVTQVALADALGCTQGNISFYEKGQMVPPDTAKLLITYAKSLGHVVTFDDIYSEGAAERPAASDNRRHTESHLVVIIPDRRTHCEPRPKQPKKRKGG